MTTPMASAPKQLETKWTKGSWSFEANGVLIAPDAGEIILCADMGWARQPTSENRALIAAAPEMAEALSEVLGALAWINAQAESAMATSAGAATADGDPNGALEMLNSIASDIGINAMMQVDKVEALLAKIGGDV